ncbi:MAG: galactokinase [Pseudomonadota bacterium]
MRRAFAASAPGRVNLIGEHTDYNGGTVLPAALSIGLKVLLTPRADTGIEVTSNGYEMPAIRDLADDAIGDWADPCVGAIREANALRLLSGGATIDVHSTIPEGSGLSSSAALIVAVLKAARQATGNGPDDVELAVAARRVENNYMGVPCGIMDQMAVALATPGTAMALDTNSLSYDLVALPAGHEMTVVHSGLTRKLTDGRYTARKIECDQAKQHFGTDDLCLLDRAIVEAANVDDIPKRRALHCLTEHARVKDALAAIQAGDMHSFGALMNESHISMRDLFEMSLPEIDALVESAVEFGASGARLTGGGFGGCIVACLRIGQRDEWLKQLLAKHPKARFIDAVSAAD